MARAEGRGGEAEDASVGRKRREQREVLLMTMEAPKFVTLGVGCLRGSPVFQLSALGSPGTSQYFPLRASTAALEAAGGDIVKAMEILEEAMEAMASLEEGETVGKVQPTGGATKKRDVAA